MRDPVANEVFRHQLISVAEEMGITLERTAYSPNIKERRDHSCAVFDRHGRLLAQAAHIPVHLGAFPLMMAALVPRFAWRPGDVVICNDPNAGGTHLPDISLVSPAFSCSGRLIAFVANRAHHADVGGAFPGSMGPGREIYQEGIIFPPLRLAERGRLNSELVELFCRNVRTPEERRGDLAAQLAANATGVRRVEELVAEYGTRTFHARASAAIAAAASAVTALLSTFPPGCYRFEDFLDSDGQGTDDLRIAVAVQASEGRLLVDFEGTAPQSPGCINATPAVTHSAVYYALICLLGPDAPINHGTFSAVDIRLPEGSLLAARHPAAVAAGNVETSQRTVDVLLGALAQAFPGRIPAASQGTMNNLSIGGLRRPSGRLWAYYETSGGGAGGSPDSPGASGVHCHMSNTRNTPAEVLEYHYPLRLHTYALRSGSGGRGANGGGDGAVRELELLEPATVTLLSDRRRRGPYGLQGGKSGIPGQNELCAGGEWQPLPDKASLEVETATRLRISTPGGGGWGPCE